MIRSNLDDLAERCRAHLLARQQQVAVAESCTGGLLSACLSAVPGSSAVYVGGVVAYANALKTQLLGVSPEVMAAQGAVSAPVAARMAEGIIRCTGAQLGLAATGIAGPGGGSREKPVGTVFLAQARPQQKTLVRQCYFEGDRAAVRQATVRALMCWLLEEPVPVRA
jgi:PncC family amidohydrolase